MIYTKGNILDSSIHYICHQVNTLGIMGGGLALQVRNRFPNVFKEYGEFIHAYEKAYNDIPLGKYCISHITDGRNIVNIFGQSSIGCGACQTNYDAVYKAFKLFYHDYLADEEQPVIAVPYKFGCGLAGGNWDRMVEIFEKLEKETGMLIVCYVYSGEVCSW